jgi:tetratricopeptide (TPR) repeat protein
MDACTEAEILEGIELAEAVRSTTTGDAPSRELPSRVGSVLEFMVAHAWVADLGDPRKAFELLQRASGSWPDSEFRPTCIKLKIHLAQVDPEERSEGVKLATDLLLSGTDWLMQIDEGLRGSAANALALALVQVPISQGPLITEAERLVVWARERPAESELSASAMAHTLALVRLRQDRAEEAVSLLRPILADGALTPRHYDDVLFTLALSLTKLGRADEALTLLKGGRRADLNPPVLDELRRSLAASGSDQDAI